MSSGTGSRPVDVQIGVFEKGCGSRRYQPPSVQVRVLKSVERLVREAADAEGYEPRTVRNTAILIGLGLLAAGLARLPRNDREFERLLAETERLARLRWGGRGP